MGSPVSMNVPNLVMEEIERSALASFDTPLKFWKSYSYVNISCIVLPKGQWQTNINIWMAIKFTVDEEKDGCLSFLDVLLIGRFSWLDTNIRHLKEFPQWRISSLFILSPTLTRVVRSDNTIKHSRDLSSYALIQTMEETRVVSTLEGNGYTPGSSYSNQPHISPLPNQTPSVLTQMRMTRHNHQLWLSRNMFVDYQKPSRVLENLDVLSRLRP